jgi:hypothetical protein
MKYILKEGELRSVIKEAVAEVLNESLKHALGSALLNTAKYAALGAVAPGMLANKGILKANNILAGNDTIAGTVKDFFGGDSTNSRNGSRKTKSEMQKDRLSSTKNISYEYGRPETVPGLGRRDKLAPKSEIVAPQSTNGIEWGNFGRHYHDEGDRVWNRKVADCEAALIRNSQGRSEARVVTLQKRYKRKLVDWLKDRDRDYEIYIKSQRY